MSVVATFMYCNSKLNKSFKQQMSSRWAMEVGRFNKNQQLLWFCEIITVLVDTQSFQLTSFRCLPGVPRRKTAFRIKQGGFASTWITWKDDGALSNFSWSLQNKMQKCNLCYHTNFKFSCVYFNANGTDITSESYHIQLHSKIHSQRKCLSVLQETAW